MNREELLKRVYKIKWWHQIDLGNGIITPGAYNTRAAIRMWNLPNNIFSGKSVLDIGAWDGFYSFYAEQHGATKVVAMDRGNLNRQSGLLLASSVLHSKVVPIVCNIYDMTEKFPGTFDTVLLLGVYYHLNGPLIGLQLAGKAANQTLIVEGPIIKNSTNKPIMFYRKTTRNHFDPFNKMQTPTIWIVNPSCMLAMLKDLGFSYVNWKYLGKRRAIFVARREQVKTYL